MNLPFVKQRSLEGVTELYGKEGKGEKREEECVRFNEGKGRS